MLSKARALELLDALENAGWESYFVGGCVRDALLGIPAHDFDICTRALPEQTAQVFSHIRQDNTGREHGTVRLLLPEGEAEITTFRTEGDYQDSRHPGWVKFVPDVEQDLARRDFTINAIAWSPRRGYVDPFGGRADLRAGVLRCVGEPETRFREDALRILRGMRFAAKYRLHTETDTRNAMLSLNALVDQLSRERVYEEFTGFLLAADWEDLVRFQPIVTRVVPELMPAVGFDQHSPHHAYDVYTHICHVTGAVPREPTLRWAALLHDVGKPGTFTQDENGRGHFKGHAQLGADMAKEILPRLKAPAAVREDAVWLIARHMTPVEAEERTLRRALSRWGEQRLEMLLTLEEADMNGKGIGEEQPARFAAMREMLAWLRQEEGCLTVRSLRVNGNDMKKLGYTGCEIGQILDALLEMVLDGSVSNDRAALLQTAQEWGEEHGICLTTPTSL